MSAILTTRRGEVVCLTLNRPEKLNALDAAMLEQLAAALDAAQEARAIVLGGAGRSFCAGADVTSLAGLTKPEDKQRHAAALEAVLLGLARSKVPVIAAVQGHALGAGCGLVASCDMVVAHANAIFGFPELARGILPALVTPPLVVAIGARQAKALLLSARMIPSQEAQSLGLVTEVSENDVLERALRRAETLAAVKDTNLARLEMLCDLSLRMPLSEALAAARRENIASRG